MCLRLDYGVEFYGFNIFNQFTNGRPFEVTGSVVLICVVVVA